MTAPALSSPGDPGALRRLLDSSVPAAMGRAGVPGVAVGVRVGSEEVAAGYGLTSVEDPLPVHERTLFQIGSVSKTFTATAVPPEPGRWALPLPGPIRLAFYASDRVVALEPPDQASLRGEFGRDARGRVAWLRWGGRLAPRLDG